MTKKELTLAVPAGIGDVSWILSKIYNKRDEIDFNIEVADGAPYRTVPFLKLFPWIKNASYGDFNYTDLSCGLLVNGFKTWKEIEECGHGRIWLSCNLHLEEGKRLEDWLPDLSTTFHYHIPCDERAVKRSDSIIQGAVQKFGHEHPIYGISAASYRGAQAWETWEYDDWAYFFNLWMELSPRSRFVLLGGGWDDLTRSLFEEFQDICLDMVGKTSIGTAIALHDLLDGYVGFSSGLGIVRVVLGKKTMMLWPKFQEKLSTSWAPLPMLKDGTYQPVIWDKPEHVMDVVEKWMKL